MVSYLFYLRYYKIRRQRRHDRRRSHYTPLLLVDVAAVVLAQLFQRDGQVGHLDGHAGRVGALDGHARFGLLVVLGGQHGVGDGMPKSRPMRVMPAPDSFDTSSKW